MVSQTACHRWRKFGPTFGATQPDSRVETSIAIANQPIQARPFTLISSARVPTCGCCWRSSWPGTTLAWWLVWQSGTHWVQPCRARGYSALVNAKSLYNGLDRATPSQQRASGLIKFSLFLQAEKGCASGDTKSPLTFSATQATFVTRMKFEIALTNLPTFGKWTLEQNCSQAFI